MTTYTYDHIHLRSLTPMETAKYFETMFGAEIIESVQSDGQPRIDLERQRADDIHSGSR